MCDVMLKRILVNDLQGTLLCVELPGHCASTFVARVIRRQGRWRRRMTSESRHAQGRWSLAA